MKLAGADLLPDPSGALYWPEQRTLMVADLHLEKGSWFAKTGQPLPPYDSLETLSRLEPLMERWQPDRVVCLGDSFHDRDAAARLDPAARAVLARLQQGREWIWVTGNHDPEPPIGLGGRAMLEMSLGPLHLRHEALTEPPLSGQAELSGHYHPKACVRVAGSRLSRPCFLLAGRRLILPAFGSYTGGLDVTDPALQAVVGSKFQVFLTGGERLYGFSDQSVLARPVLARNPAR